MTDNIAVHVDGLRPRHPPCYVGQRLFPLHQLWNFSFARNLWNSYFTEEIFSTYPLACWTCRLTDCLALVVHSAHYWALIQDRNKLFADILYKYYYLTLTSTKGTAGPGRPPLAYLLAYVITNATLDAAPIECSVTHRAATSLAAAG